MPFARVIPAVLGILLGSQVDAHALSVVLSGEVDSADFATYQGLDPGTPFSLTFELGPTRTILELPADPIDTLFYGSVGWVHTNANAYLEHASNNLSLNIVTDFTFTSNRKPNPRGTLFGTEFWLGGWGLMTSPALATPKPFAQVSSWVEHGADGSQIYNVVGTATGNFLLRLQFVDGDGSNSLTNPEMDFPGMEGWDSIHFEIRANQTSTLLFPLEQSPEEALESFENAGGPALIGTVTSMAVVPEPAALSAAMVAGALLATRRNRRRG